MNEDPRAPKVVSLTPGKPRVPEPHPAEYGDAPDEMFAHIDRETDQAAMAAGKVVKRFA
ncbi:MAG: hypothetical protein JWM33_2199 [Caulobacteraceae bacterium]|nr:hypothetical protein [Caulobacteraceae bacterium]